jgi:hypothetical protein
VSADVKPDLKIKSISFFRKQLPHETAIAIVLSTTILCTAVPRPKQLEPPPDPNLADILCFWAKAVKDEVDLQLQLDRRPRCYYLPLFLTVDTGQGREWYCVWPQGTLFHNGKTSRRFGPPPHLPITLRTASAPVPNNAPSRRGPSHDVAAPIVPPLLPPASDRGLRDLRGRSVPLQLPSPVADSIGVSPQIPLNLVYMGTDRVEKYHAGEKRPLPPFR